jgi:hypothetical protein
MQTASSWSLGFLVACALAACGPSVTHPEPVSAPVVPSVSAAPLVPIAVTASRPDPPPWRDGERFRVRLEQDGAEVPIVDHRVALARHAFTFVFELQGVDFIDVNASYVSRNLDLARSHEPLTGDDAPFGTAHGAAEEVDPPHRIFVDDEAFNLWGWRADMHRCHDHEMRDPEGQAPFDVCKRVVETFGHGTDETPVEKSTARALYVVVMSTEVDGFTTRELQRDWVTIDFR